MKAENIEKFTQMVYEYSDPMEKFPSVELTADKLLMPQDINLDNVKGLAAMEPFGAENPAPVFAIKSPPLPRKTISETAILQAVAIAHNPNKKSLHLIGAGNIDRKIPLLLLDILLQVIHQTDAVTAIRRPEFGPQGLCIVLAQRFESRLQPLGQFALVIKLVAGALEGIPHIPSIVAQIPVTDPIAPEPDLRDRLRNRYHAGQIKQPTP